MAIKPQKTDLQLALKNCRGSFAIVGFFSFFVNLLMLVPSLYMLQLYDRVLSSGSQVTLLMLTLLMVMLMVVMGALEWMRSAILVRVSNRIEMNLNQRLYDAVFRMSLYTGGRGASTEALNDLTNLRQFLTSAGVFAFFDAPWIPIYMFVMFAFHPLLGWMAIGGGLVLVVIAIINHNVTNPPLRDSNKFQMAASGMTSASIRNAEVIESMGMLDNIRSLWLKNNLHSLSYQSKASQRAGFLANFSKTFRMLLQSLVLGAGAYLAINQEISPGLMIAGSILLGRALAPIDLMIGSWKGFISARQQYDRLNNLLSQIPRPEEKMALPVPTGNIFLESAVVGAPGTRTPIIKGIKLSIEAGESVAVVGPSGAGKSTLARAILGIWPCLSGKIRLDGADIFSWNRADLGPHIGYLPQDIELFDGTISENISRFGDLDPEAVVKAAQMSGVHDLILQFPDGYDTVIGATGGVLSGGQRQRIGLARAIYGDPILVVLDEPNSNLDQLGELALSEALEQMRTKGITVIIITHRPSVLAQVDKVLFIKDGRAEMYGPREEVLSKLTASQSGSQSKKPAPLPRPSSPKPILPAHLKGNI
jgi:ATP-binding cassette subfamily C protein EexD